jgi:hypothetical protein
MPLLSLKGDGIPRRLFNDKVLLLRECQNVTELRFFRDVHTDIFTCSDNIICIDCALLNN